MERFIRQVALIAIHNIVDEHIRHKRNRMENADDHQSHQQYNLNRAAKAFGENAEKVFRFKKE